MERKISSETQPVSLNLLIFSVAISLFLLPCMVAGVGPALPFIGAFFKASATELSLVNAAYALGLAVFNLLAGRIGDILGRRKVFFLGLGLFVVISGALPFSPTITVFLALRFIQAVGAACMNTSALAILVVCSPKNQIGRVLGVALVGPYLGISLGPTLSGLMVTYLGWSYFFFLMVPLGIFAWIMMAVTVKGEWKVGEEDGFDWKGAFFYALGVAMLSAGTAWILKTFWSAGFFVAGLLSLWYFFKIERGRKAPILDVDFITKNKPFLFSSLAAFINYSLVFGVGFYFSLFLQVSYGFSPLETGLTLLIQPLIQVIGSPAAGRLADKYGPTKIAMIGMVLCGVGLLFATGLDADTDFVEILYTQAALGVGVALFASPNNAAIMRSVDDKHISQASGMVGTARTLGLLLSMVIISLTMYAYLGEEPLTKETVHSFLRAMDTDFFLFGIINALAIALSYWSFKARKKELAL